MLAELYIMERGFQKPNPEVTITDELIIQYVIAFDNATATVIETGEIVPEYCYYYEQLEAFANTHPLFNYNKIERQYQDLLSPFFNKIVEKKNRMNKYLNR